MGEKKGNFCGLTEQKLQVEDVAFSTVHDDFISLDAVCDLSFGLKSYHFGLRLNYIS